MTILGLYKTMEVNMKLNQTSEGIERRGFLKLIAGPPALFYIPPSRSSQSILILETVLAGFVYYDAEVIWHNLKVGGSFGLKREPHNHYEQKAIDVFWKDNKLGYAPKVDDDRWERIGMNIELVLS